MYESFTTGVLPALNKVLIQVSDVNGSSGINFQNLASTKTSASSSAQEEDEVYVLKNPKSKKECDIYHYKEPIDYMYKRFSEMFDHGYPVRIKETGDILSIEDTIVLYGLQMQLDNGDAPVHDGEPRSHTEMVKQKSWEQHRGDSREKCMIEYVEKAGELLKAANILTESPIARL